MTNNNMKLYEIILAILSATAPLTMALSSIQPLSVACRSRVGFDSNRPQKVNQDAYFHIHVDYEEICGCLVGIMDGHGLKGHLVTQFLSERLPQRIVEQLKEPRPQTEWEAKMKELAKLDVEEEISSLNDPSLRRIHDTLRHAFHQAHVDAINAEEVPAGRSGTTCIACFVDNKYVHVAHVGDSRAIMIGKDGMVDVLTTETTVSNLPDDARRIQEGEGRDDRQGNVWYGPVGISMTRALGDAVMLRAGVVPTPLVQSFPLAERGSSTLVLATDGIFDVLSNEAVVDIVSKESSSLLEDAADTLLERARHEWLGADLPFVEEKMDDMTCVIVKL